MEHRLRVLLVEDDLDHAELIQDHLDILQGQPVQWEHVGSLAEAAARVQEGRLDAILLDLRLPDSDLQETVPRMVAAANGVPIIALTSLNDADFGLLAVQQGAQDYLVKAQLSSELLLRAIRYAVERARHGQESEAVNARLREQEALLRELNATLERRVAHRTAELEKANAKLQSRNQELRDFAYIASHDLQEPLRKIRAFSSLLMTEQGQNIGEEGRHYLRRITSAAERLSALVLDLLALSRVNTRGEGFTAVPLNSVVAGVLRDLDLVVQETRATVEVGALPQIEGDELQMRRLFYNLLHNALKFHRPDTPTTVRIRAEAGEDGHAGQTCRIVIEDEGIGFDEKYLDRIFSPFQRLHARGEYEGNGMGLAIVRRIAERHGGTVTAESTPGQGSRFLVMLPLRQPITSETTDAYERRTVE